MKGEITVSKIVITINTDSSFFDRSPNHALASLLSDLAEQFSSDQLVQSLQDSDGDPLVLIEVDPDSTLSVPAQVVA